MQVKMDDGAITSLAFRMGTSIQGALEIRSLTRQMGRRFWSPVPLLAPSPCGTSLKEENLSTYSDTRTSRASPDWSGSLASLCWSARAGTTA
jgi:hypothetical protein